MTSAMTSNSLTATSPLSGETRSLGWAQPAAPGIEESSAAGRRFDEQLAQARQMQQSRESESRDDAKQSQTESARPKGHPSETQVPAGPQARAAALRANRQGPSDSGLPAAKAQDQAHGPAAQDKVASALPAPSGNTQPSITANGEAAAEPIGKDTVRASGAALASSAAATSANDSAGAEAKLQNAKLDTKQSASADSARTMRTAPRSATNAGASSLAVTSHSTAADRAAQEASMPIRADGLAAGNKTGTEALGAFSMAFAQPASANLSDPRPAGAAQHSAVTSAATSPAPISPGPSGATEVSTGHTAASHHASIETPLHHPEFPRALASDIRLAVTAGVQRATIQINPEELGPIRIEIQMQGNQASIQFDALDSRTRDAVQSSREILHTMLASEGMALTRFDLGGDRSGFSQQFLRSQGHTPGFSDSHEMTGALASTVDLPKATPRHSGLLNLVA